jgi:hypothetical protein
MGDMPEVLLVKEQGIGQKSRYGQGGDHNHECQREETDQTDASQNLRSDVHCFIRLFRGRELLC